MAKMLYISLREVKEMLENTYFYEKIYEFKQKEIDELTKNYWKFIKTENETPMKYNPFLSTLKKIINSGDKKGCCYCCA